MIYENFTHLGPICADEIGVNMRTNYMIKYDFKGNYKSTIAEKIHVGFTTTDPKGRVFHFGKVSRVSFCKMGHPIAKVSCWAPTPT